MRAYNCLRRAGLITIGAILTHTEEKLIAIFKRRFRTKTLLVLEHEPGRSTPSATETISYRSEDALYEELREKLDELGMVPQEIAWPGDKNSSHEGAS